MSGSPKRVQVQLAAARAQQLERQQRELARRRAEERERQVRARNRRQRAAEALLVRVADRHRAAADLPAQAARQIEGLAKTAESAARAIQDERSLAAATASVSNLERAVAAASLASAERQQDQAKRLAALRVETENLPTPLALASDSEGAVAVVAVLAELEGSLAARDQQKFDAIFEEGAAIVRRHVERVRARRGELEAEASDVASRITDLEVHIEAAARDAAGLPGVDDAVESARQAVLPIKSELAAWRLDESARLLSLAGQRAEALDAVVEEATRRLDERRAVVETLREGLADLGFAIDAGSHMSDSAGTVGFRARHISGWGLALTVGNEDKGEDSDQIKYVVERSVREISQAEDGSVIQRCDSASDVLDAVHDRMRGKGVDVGRLTWDGMPDDPRGAVAQHPDSSGARRERS
jgi:hypothetical protein